MKLFYYLPHTKASFSSITSHPSLLIKKRENRSVTGSGGGCLREEGKIPVSQISFRRAASRRIKLSGSPSHLFIFPSQLTLSTSMARSVCMFVILFAVLAQCVSVRSVCDGMAPRMCAYGDDPLAIQTMGYCREQGCLSSPSVLRCVGGRMEDPATSARVATEMCGERCGETVGRVICESEHPRCQPYYPPESVSGSLSIILPTYIVPTLLCLSDCMRIVREACCENGVPDFATEVCYNLADDGLLGDGGFYQCSNLTSFGDEYCSANTASSSFGGRSWTDGIMKMLTYVVASFWLGSGM